MENTNSTNAPVRKANFVLGIVISLCAIAEFIIWIVDANRVHSSNLVVMGVGLLAISGGVLGYLLSRAKSRALADTLLWIGVIACVVLLFIGIAIS